MGRQGCLGFQAPVLSTVAGAQPLIELVVILVLPLVC